MATILITGGAGFIGTNISLVALKKGYSVICFDNLLRTGSRENLNIFKKNRNWEYISGDITNPTDFAKISKPVDAVIALAANPSVSKSVENPLFDAQINIVGHLNTLEFAKKNHIPLLFASSSKVYTDKINTFPLDETPKRYVFRDKNFKGINEAFDINGFDGFTHSPYGVSKLAAEKYCREYAYYYGVQVVMNRMGCVFGLHQLGAEEQGWLDWFLRARLANKPITIFGTGKQVRDLVFGFDVAELFLKQLEMIDKVAGQTYCVGGGTPDGYNISLLEALEMLNELVPKKQNQVIFKNERSGDQKILILNTEKVFREVGWKPTTTVKDGFQQMLERYVEEAK